MISVQLWSLRDVAAVRGWDAVVADLAEGGFTNVEPYAVARTAPLIRDALRRHGMSTPTVHGDLTGDELPRTLEAAAELGATLVAHPGFIGDRWRDPATVEEVAEVLFAASEAAAALGLRVAFHHHDDELRNRIDGVPALLVLLRRLGTAAGLQFDPHWTTIAGLDVLETMRALGPSIVAFHVKDGPPGGRNEDQRALGEGALDWRSFLAAADPRTPRVISLDEFSGDALAGVLASLRWLEQHDPAVVGEPR
jgi:sugar phosphate isomerase/epimerase